MSCCAVDTLGGVPAGTPSNPLSVYEDDWEFTGLAITAYQGWQRSIVVGGAVAQGTVATTTDPGHPGTIDLSIDFAAGASRATWRRSPTSIVATGGRTIFECIAQVVSGPDVALDDYTALVGMFDGVATPSVIATGFGFGLEVATSAVNWLRISATGGARTVVDTGIPFTVGAWQRFLAIVNDVGTVVDYFIQDVGGNLISAGQSVTNIPTAAVDFGSTITATAIGGAGGATLVLALDYWRERKEIFSGRP